MMGAHSSSKYDVKLMPQQEEMDFTCFSPIAHLPLDDFSGYSEHFLWDYHYEAPLYSSLDIEQNENVVRGCNALCGLGNGFGGLDETICDQFGFVTNDIQIENRSLVCGDNKEISHVSVEAILEDEKDKRTRVEKKCGVSKMLCRETISKHFYMPIRQAAKELNIGLKSLKKRCRELGIRRWPYRKLKSLETAIKSAQDFGKDQGVIKMREAIKVFENEKKLIEEAPDLQLDETTKGLRQACFKAIYKKRRLTRMNDCPSSSNANGGEVAAEDDDDEAAAVAIETNRRR